MYDLREMMVPLWKGDTVRQESIIFTEETGYRASLLNVPERILQLTSPATGEIFREGRDYVMADGCLILTAGSAVPRLSLQEQYPDRYRQGQAFGCIDGGYVRFSEGSFWHSLQVSVTYRVRAWHPVPVPETSERLPRTRAILQQRRDLRMVVYGDSISQGYNASGFVGAPPYLPAYGELTAAWACSTGHPVWLKNAALAGAASQWGVENVRERVCQYRPDLTILAFGMNDGTVKVPGELFRERIRQMRAEIRRESPDCEFVLIAPTLPNSRACLPQGEKLPMLGTQKEFAEQLRLLREPGTEVLDMTAIHGALLEKKQFADMTGNNVNHPNDYLHRWYAQSLCRLLGISLPEV